MNIETGVAVLFALRRRGFAVRKASGDNVQVSPFDRLKDSDKKMIVANKQFILAALAGEGADGAQGAEKKARDTMQERKVPYVLATESSGDWTYVAILRRGGMGWTIRIPNDQYDPFRFAEAIHRVDKAMVIA